MNTITKIENALKSLNQATFQNMVNHLLFLEGKQFIGAPGSVVGKDKTSKGTPDSFFVRGDKYIFVESTTQEKLGESKTFFNKLLKDIDHCFAEGEIIPNEQIEEVILACNEKISPDEHGLLVKHVNSYNPATELSLLNIQNLPLKIFEFPKLSEEYLDVQIIKGEIFRLEEFLVKTTKGLQPSLTNEFIGREKEMEKCIGILKDCDKLLLTGGAGVGKSKLAVQVLSELAQQDHIPIVIQSSLVSLWDDYSHLFMPGKNYIILFDDANKSVGNLEYLLSKIEGNTAFNAKLIVTCRDYVKRQVSNLLGNYKHEELQITEFKEEDIRSIIVGAMPILKYANNSHIKTSIVELAKGNARVALMAANSVTPDAETNYLTNPVLLYEKYFKKISEEVGIFNNPTVLKSLAIVSFFGVLDKNDIGLRDILENDFGIDWNDLWLTIMELHNFEILDVHPSEVVKVSDQVLATYAFYKCFLDEKSAVISYSKWISTFVSKFSRSVSYTLVDINNTFNYFHVKELVEPHLDEVVKEISTEEQMYSFYNLFWFYKGMDCLVYLKKWIDGLPSETLPDDFQFSYVHNNHTKASKHFELLYNFWNHPNELHKPSIELALALAEKQPSRLPEILKFINDGFKYKIMDRDHGYARQNNLLDVLLEKDMPLTRKRFADGIFLNIAETLFGWHYTEFGSAKGGAFSILNFDLYKSDSLMVLRKRILEQIYTLCEPGNNQVDKVLNKIIRPGAKIDQSIYLEEMQIYDKIICEKLDVTQYSHSSFVHKLSEKIIAEGGTYPQEWNRFINSEILKLSRFLHTRWERSLNKGYEEIEKERQDTFDTFLKSNTWEGIEKLLLDVNRFYLQQHVRDLWEINGAISSLYTAMGRKHKEHFEKALRLYFEGRVCYQLNPAVINSVLFSCQMNGRELFTLIDAFDFETKLQWLNHLLMIFPEEQIEMELLYILIENFQNPENRIFVYQMQDYLKYGNCFDLYKVEHPMLKDHNIITHLTSLILAKEPDNRSFGYHFCSENAKYFEKNVNLLKEVYWVITEENRDLDHDGREIKAIMDLDSTFLVDSLKNGSIGLDWGSKIRLKDISTNFLWDSNDYESLIEEILLIIIEKEEFGYVSEEDISSLFILSAADDMKREVVKRFLIKLIKKHVDNKRVLLLLMSVVYENYNAWIVECLRELLFLNKDFEIVKDINLSGLESWSGSRVPVIQKKIDLYNEILQMIKSLPSILDYSQHIAYFEERIKWKKKEIKSELRSDFMEVY